MSNPSFFHIKGSDDQQFILKVDEKINNKEKKLILDMAEELVKEGAEDPAKITQTITIEKIDLKNRTVTFKGSHDEKIVKRISFKAPSTATQEKPFEVKELSFAKLPKRGWTKNFLNKVGKWSFFVPVVGWGIGTAWLISRHYEKKKVSQLMTKAEHQLERGSLRRDAHDFIDSHQTMIDKLKRLKKDLPAEELEKAQQINDMIELLKASQKNGKRLLNCHGNLASLNKAAQEMAAAIQQQPPVLIPSYYHNNKGEIQPILLHFYKEKENDEVLMQRIEVNADAEKVFDSYVYKINQDADLAKMLQGIFRFQIPPEKHEEKLEDKAMDKAKLIAQKGSEKRSGKKSKVEMASEPNLALSAEIEAFATFSEEKSKKLTHARSPTILKPFQVFIREKFSEKTYDKLVDLRDQMETLAACAEMLSHDTKGSLSGRLERLNSLVGMMEQAKERAKKRIGHDEAWSFFMAEKEQQLNALIDECREKTKTYEAKLSKNRPKLIARLGKGSQGWKDVKLPEKIILETPQRISISDDPHLSNLEKLSKADSIAPLLSIDKNAKLAHLSILQILNDVLNEDSDVPLKEDEYAQLLGKASDDQLEEIGDRILTEMRNIYPMEGDFHLYDQIKGNYINQLISEIKGEKTALQVKHAWDPILSFLHQLLQQQPMTDEIRQEIQLVNQHGSVDKAKDVLSAEIDDSFKKASELFSSRLLECRAALDDPEGDTQTHLRRLKAIDMNISKLIEELPLPKVFSEHPKNYWTTLNSQEIDLWQTHLRDAMAIWAETRARLGEPTLTGRQFVTMARGTAIANQLFRMKGIRAQSLLEKKWAEAMTSLPDNDPKKIELIQMVPQPTGIYPKPLIQQRRFFVLGRIGKLVGMSQEELLPLLHVDYSVGRQTVLENLRINSSKVSSLSSEQLNALNAIRYFYERSDGGKGGPNRAYESDISFTRFDLLKEESVQGTYQPEIDYMEDNRVLLLGYQTEEPNAPEVDVEIATYSPETAEKAFQAVVEDDNTYFDPALTMALQINAFCRMLLDTSRLGLAFKDEQEMVIYFMSRINQVPIEVIKEKSLEDIIKTVIKQDNLKTLLEKVGPWKLKVDPDNMALLITDNEENATIQYSEEAVDLGIVSLKKEQAESPIFAQVPRKDAFNLLHRCMVAAQPDTLVREIKSELEPNKGLDPETQWNKTIRTENQIYNICFSTGFGTGLTPEQEWDLATLEVMMINPREAREKVVHHSTVSQVFAFIVSYPDLLSNIGVQQRLREILNRPELLQRALHLNPEAFATFGQFASELIKKEINNPPTPENIRKLTFLMELCTQLNQEVEFAQKLMENVNKDFYAGRGEEGIYIPDEVPEIKRGVAVSDPKDRQKFIDHLDNTLQSALQVLPNYFTPIKGSQTFQQILKTWTAMPNPDIKEMAKELNLYLIQSYFSLNLDTLTDDQWLELFNAYAVVANTGGTVINASLNKSVKDWMENQAIPSFKKTKLSGTARDPMLQKLAKALLPSISISAAAGWDEPVPGIYLSKDGACTLDITRALVFDRHGRSNSISPIPSEIRKHPLFSQIFNERLSQDINAECRLGSKPGSYIYLFKHDNRQFQIQHDTQSNEIAFCQEIQIGPVKHLYVFEPSPTISGKGSQKIIQQKGLWRQQDNPKEALCLLGEQDKFTLEDTLFLHFKTPKKSLPVLSAEKIIKFVTHTKIEPVKTVELQSVRTANGKEIINTNPEALEDLFGFIDTQDILLMGRKGKVDEIRLPHLKITLKQEIIFLDGKKQLVWKAYGMGKNKKEFDDCILLRDASVLTNVFGSNFKNFMLPLYDLSSHTCKLVMRPLEVQPPSFEKEETLWLDTNIEESFRSSRFTVCFNPQDKSLSSTTEGFMNLAYLAAGQKQYEKAAEYLKQAIIAPAPTDPAAKQEALKIIQRLGQLIRKLPQDSTNSDLFRLKFELAHMKIRREQFAQEEFVLQQYKERLKFVSEISDLYIQVKEKQDRQLVSGLLKLTPQDIQEYERFVEESLKFLFEKIEEEPQVKSPYYYVKVPSSNTDTSPINTGIIYHAQKPNPKVTVDQVPAYLTVSSLFRNLPSYWNDIVKNRREVKDIIPLLRGVIAEDDENNQQMIKQALSMLFALATYISTFDEGTDISKLSFPNIDFPEISKLHGDVGIMEMVKLGKMDESMDKLNKFFNAFIGKVQIIPKDQKSYKSRDIDEDEGKKPSEPMATIDEILEKLEDSEFKEKFSEQERDQWKNALLQLQKETDRNAETDPQKFKALELIDQLMGREVLVPLQRYQRVLEQRAAVESTPSSAAITTGSSSTMIPAEPTPTVQEWNEIKTLAFNQTSLLRPDEEILNGFAQLLTSSRKARGLARLKIEAALQSSFPANDLLLLKMNISRSKGSEKAALWYKLGCLELKVATKKLKIIEQNLIASNASNADIQTITDQIKSLKDQLTKIQDDLSNDDFQSALDTISAGLVNVQQVLAEAKTLYVKNALSLPTDIDENLEAMIDESNRLTGEATSTAFKKETIKTETPDIAHLDHIENLEKFIKTQEKAVGKEVSEAEKKVLQLAKDLSEADLHGFPREVLLFKEKVSKFSDDEILRFATDLYLDDYLRNANVSDTKNNMAVELHQAIENFMTLQIQHKGILSSVATVGKLAKLKKDYQSGKINTQEKIDAFEINWSIASKELFSMLDRSQTVQRHINIDDDLVRRSIIRMEWKQGFPLREEQIVYFLKLLDNPEELLLFRTGGGKTSVFFPLAIEVFLRQGRFPFQLVTEKLHQQFLVDMDPKTRELFSQGADPFVWTNKTIVKVTNKNQKLVLQNLSYLQDRYTKLFLAQSEKNLYPVARIRDVASLRHDLTELQKLIKEKNAIIRDEKDPKKLLQAKNALGLILQQYHWSKKIWSVIHSDNVSFLADEPDAIVPATKEINRSSGGDHSQLSEAIPSTLQPVLETLLDPAKRPAGNWPALDTLQKAILIGRQETLSLEQREAGIKDLAKIIYQDANEYLNEFITQYFEGDLDQFHDQVTEDEFVAYMTGKPITPDTAVKRPDAFPDFPKESKEKDSLNSLLILKDWLENVLDIALQKQPGNKYGVDRSSNCTIVPYEDWEQDAQPNMFSNPLLITTLTYLYYVAFPFKEDFLNAQRIPEPLDDWSKRFKLLAEPTLVFDRVPIYDQQYRCNTQHAVLGVKLGGASATGEVYALPFKKSKEPPNPKELLVSVSMMINEMGDGLEAEIEEFSDPQAAFNAEIIKPEVKAIIDQAGSLKGKTNNQAVQGLISHLEKKRIDTLINFIDASNRQKTQAGTKIKDKPTPLTAQQKMYYGPKDGRGTHFDIPFGEGVIFFGANVSEEEMLQTIGRLRELGKGHTLRFRLDTVVADKIRATLNLPANQSVKTKELFQYIELTTLQSHSRMNLKAERLRIQAASLTAFEKAHLKPQAKNPREWTSEDFSREALEAEMAYDIAEAHQLGLSKQTDTRAGSYEASKKGDTYDQLLREREAERDKLAGICTDAIVKVLPDLEGFATTLKEELIKNPDATKARIMEQIQMAPANAQAVISEYLNIYTNALNQCNSIIAEMQNTPEIKSYHASHLPKKIQTSDLSNADNEQEVEISTEKEQEQEQEQEQEKLVDVTGTSTPEPKDDVIPRVDWKHELIEQLTYPQNFLEKGFFHSFEELRNSESVPTAMLFREGNHFSSRNHALLYRNAKQTGSGMRLAVVGKRPDGSFAWLHIDKLEFAYKASKYVASTNLQRYALQNWLKEKNKEAGDQAFDEPKIAVVAITPAGIPYSICKTEHFDETDFQSESFTKEWIRHKIYFGHINFPEQEHAALLELIESLDEEEKEQLVDLIIKQRGVKNTGQIFGWPNSTLYQALQGTL